MSNLTADEALLLASFMKFPELMIGYSDLTRFHFGSDFAWVMYSAMINADVEQLRNNMYHVAFNLSRDKIITSDDFAWILDDFGVIAFSYSAEEAYNALMDKADLLKMKNRLAQIFEINDAVELREAVANIIADRMEREPHMESIASVTTHTDSCGFDFGLPALDRFLDIEKTDLIIIAARPFSGKTTFAVQLALELTRFGKIQFWSMEMSKARIKDKVNHHGDRYRPENFLIRETNTTTIQKIFRQALRDKPVAIFIDQLNKVQGKGVKEYEQFTSVARGLKELSGQLHIPIFCLAQINRDAQNGRPNLFQLKGSGSIEEEADVVMLLHVPTSGTTILQLDKNRTKKGYVNDFSLDFGGGVSLAQIYTNCQTISKPEKGQK